MSGGRDVAARFRIVSLISQIESSPKVNSQNDTSRAKEKAGDNIALKETKSLWNKILYKKFFKICIYAKKVVPVQPQMNIKTQKL